MAHSNEGNLSVDLQALTPRVGRVGGNLGRQHGSPGLAAGAMPPVLDLRGQGQKGDF